MFPAVEEAACGYPEQPLGSLVTVDFLIFMIFMMILSCHGGHFHCHDFHDDYRDEYDDG